MLSLFLEDLHLTGFVKAASIAAAGSGRTALRFSESGYIDICRKIKLQPLFPYIIVIRMVILSSHAW